MKEMEAVCSCLSKFICYNYEMMCEFDKKVIAGCLAEYVLEMFKVKVELDQEF